MAGRIKGITVVIGGDTTGLEKSLKNVNDTIRKTQSSLKDVNKLLKLDPTNTTLLTQKQGYLKTAIDATKTKLDALKEAQAQAKVQFENGTLGADKYEALQREVIATEEDLKALQAQQEKAMTVFDRIGEIGDKFGAIGEDISDAGKKLMPLSAALAAVGTAAMAAWHQMDDAYDNITAKTGATGEKAEELSDTFTKVFSSMPVESRDASDAIADITQKLNLTGDALTTASEQFLKFAEVNDVDVNTAVENVAKSMNDAGISGDQVSDVLDMLTAASQASGISVDKLSEALDTNGVTMRQLGLNTEQTIALLATMEKNGVDVASVLTGLKYATKTYAAENKDASVEIQKLFSSIKDGSASAADAQAVFGTRAGTILYEYVKEGKLDFQDLADSLENADGRLSETFEDMEDPVDKMKVAYNNLKLAGASLGDSLNTVLAPVFTAAAKGAQFLANALMTMPEPIKDTIAAIGAFGAAAGPAFLGVGTFIQKVSGSIKAFGDFGNKLLEMKDKISEAAASSSLLSKALSFAAQPAVLAVAAAIAVLIGAFVTLWNTNSRFRENITRTWNQITSAVGNFVNGMNARFGTFGSSFGKLMSAVSSAWMAFCNVLGPVFEAAFSALAAILQGVLNILTGIIDVFTGIFTGHWETLWKGIQEIFSGTWTAISGTFSSLFGGLTSAVSGFMNSISSAWRSGWNSIASFFRGILNTISSFVKSILNGIKNTVTSVLSAISGVFHSIWGAISSFFSGQLSGMSQSVTDRFGSMRSTISSISGSILSIITSVWSGIQSAVTGAARSIYSGVTSVFHSVSSSVSGIFGGLRSTVSAIWAGIRNAIIGPIQSAVGSCQRAAYAIRNAFSGIHISIPHFSLPHLSVSGSFSLNPPSVPHFGISWYAQGGILTNPTIFGMSSSSLLAGGESGPEAVLPLDSFYKQMEKIMARNSDTSRMENLLAVIAENSAKGVYLDNGTLVGYLLPAIDAGLGKSRKLKARLAL